MRVAFHTFGCKVNQFDTEGLIDNFQSEGYEVVPLSEEADVYVINTCTVTKTAEQKARQFLRKIKKSHPESLVVVTGCYAQTNPEAIENLPEADLIIGIRGRIDLVKLVEERLSCETPREFKDPDTEDLKKPTHTGRIQVCSWESTYSQRPDFEIYTPKFAEKTRAFLKIQDGCESYCSYCKIPFARGPIRSLPPLQALAEVRRLKASGFKELVLVGIHLGNYGKDLGKNLAVLLREIEKENETGFRVRLSSVEPTDFTPELIEVVLGSRLLCPHLHIPLQSGSDAVLTRMNRHYSTSDYALLLRKLRSGNPNLAVSTDLMVGFPGETEEEFGETMRFLKAQNFSGIHIFPFSPREGTKAATMSGQIGRKEKERRATLAEDVANEVTGGYRRGLLGKMVEVLTEEEIKPGIWEGFCGEYLRTRLRGDLVEGVKENTLVRGKVIDADQEPLIAE